MRKVRGLSLAAVWLACACRASGETGDVLQVHPRRMADAIHAVLSADRAVYTREVVARLQDEEAVLRASEHFRDDRALPLPAQMFRMGAEATMRDHAGVSYALISPWPINRQNAPRTTGEQLGAQTVVATGQSSYGVEVLGGVRYFTAIYPDKALSDACVACHNAHRDSPRHDFRRGETMGVMVVRIPLDP